MRFHFSFYILLTTVLIEVLCDCGIRAPNKNPSGADIFPWHVVIYDRRDDGTFKRWCFGTLISSDVVVTAWRCIIEAQQYVNQFYVVSSIDAPQFIPANMTIQKTRVESRYNGQRYNAWGAYSSQYIVWLVLEHPFNVTSPIAPACIDLENQEDIEELPVGLIGEVVYYNDVSENDLAKPEIRSLTVVNTSHSFCSRFLAIVKVHNVTVIPPCAQFSTVTDHFTWTVGSGFYSQHNGRWYLRAVIVEIPVINDDDGRHEIALMMNVQHYVDEINRSGAIKKCGIAAPPIRPFIINGYRAELGQYPWHVGVYRQNSAGLYDSICAGSLISTRIVLSAAHCFFDEVRRRQQAVSGFAVAGGKFYRLYDWPEKFAQKSPVKTIHIPSKYYGVAGNYAEDIAWLILQHPFYHSALVTPVCIDFGNSHQNEDLQDGRVGKIAGWGRTAADAPSNELQEINVPFVPHDRCILALPQDFIQFVGSDKFCAGYTNGTRLCDGDSGGGLVFSHGGTWYLRGIVSVGPPSAESTCAASYTAFTDVGRFNDEHRRIMNTLAHGFR